jgi:hypothetical protein
MLNTKQLVARQIPLFNGMFSGRQPPQDMNIFSTFQGVTRSPSSECFLWLGRTKPPATTLHWILSPRKLQYYIPLLVINRSLLLGSFWMPSQNNSSGVLRYHSRTATWPVFSPLLKLRTQFNTVSCAGAFSQRTADNRRWISDGLTPSFHSNLVVHPCP